MKTSLLLFVATIIIVTIEIFAKIDLGDFAIYTLFAGIILLGLEGIENAIKNLKK